MALPHKPGPAQVFNPTGDVDEFPKLPQQVKDRFPEMVQWETVATTWWMNFKTIYQRDRSQLQATLTSMSAQISDLQARVTKLGG